MTKYLLAILFTASLLHGGELDTWTSADGATMEAELIEYAKSSNSAFFKSASGRVFQVGLLRFAEADQKKILAWAAKTQPTLAPSSKPKKESEKGPGKLDPGMAELLPATLLNQKGQQVSREQLAGKIVGFYFSAHWCPPCRAFTPSLVKFRDTNKKDFEVVFVSSDTNPKAQMNYMKETDMKWPTMKHRSKEANALAQKYGVRSYPSLIIVGPDGKTITKNGREDVSFNPGGALTSWKKAS